VVTFAVHLSLVILPIPPSFPGPWVLLLLLVEKGEVPPLHSLNTDKTWYFHQGATLDLHIFDRNQYHNVKLVMFASGADCSLQFTVPVGTILGAILNRQSKDTYSFVSCSVCPGFKEEGFFWLDIAELRRKFKAHQ